MANRIVGNVYIIDSQSGALAPLKSGDAWPAADAYIHTVAFWSADTTGLFELVYAADSNNTAFLLANPNHFDATVDIHLGVPVRFSELRAKTVTAGTGFIYFA